MSKRARLAVWSLFLVGLNCWAWRPVLNALMQNDVPAPRYTVTDLGTLGKDWVYHGGAGLNNKGEVVGASLTESGDEHGFLWRSGSMTDLGTLPGSSESIATAVNDHSQIVGESGGRAFLWQNGLMRDLGTLPGYSDSWANSINDQGQVVGRAFTPRPDLAWSSWPTHAFLWQNGVMHDLGVPRGCTSSRAYGINAQSQVVGWALSTDGHSHAFLWQGGKMTDIGLLTGKKLSRATSINDQGQIAGDAGDGTNGMRGYLWQNGKLSNLGTLPGCTYYRAIAVNNNSQVVGEASIGEGHVTFEQVPPFLWDASQKMQNLANFLPTDCRWQLHSAFAINDRGQILGFGYYEGHADRLCLLTPTAASSSISIK